MILATPTFSNLVQRTYQGTHRPLKDDAGAHRTSADTCESVCRIQSRLKRIENSNKHCTATPLFLRLLKSTKTKSEPTKKMRKKGKRLEEGLKTLSASKGKAGRMRLQMTTRPSTSTSTSSDLQTPTLSDLQTSNDDDEHFFNLNTSNETSSSIRDTVWEYLLKQFSFYDLTKQRSKFEKIINDILEVQPDPENANVFQIAHEVINKVFAFGLNKNNTNLTQCLEFEEFPLAAPEEGRFHDFECPGINHYYIATSQYYKMLLQPLQTPFPKTIENKANSVQSVEHICNPKTLENYNAKKQAFKEAGKVNIEKKVQEILLFHGTDAANIDSILKEGFNVDFNPKHKSKMQRYGRGIYVAEHPEMAFMYGNIILLCKVRKTHIPSFFTFSSCSRWRLAQRRREHFHARFF